MVKSSALVDPTIIDAASLFDALAVISERAGRERVTMEYARLRARLDSFRKDNGWRLASFNTMLLSIDPNSEGQQRFQAMLRHNGFDLDIIPFRENYVSMPPGRSPSEANGKPITSLAPRVAYIAGLMARHTDPHFLVVSHAFELCAPLVDLAQRFPNGKIGIAYFGSLLDYRWKSAGLFDQKKLPISFFDLDEHGEELIGVDLVGRSSGSRSSQVGLSKF